MELGPLSAMLESHLMLRDPNTRLLSLSFPAPLLAIFTEVSYWEKLRRTDVPATCHDIIGQRDALRILRANVALVVSEYNDILLSLTSRQKALFSERIAALDRRIAHGLKGLTWESAGAILEFSREARKAAASVGSVVSEFKANEAAIKE